MKKFYAPAGPRQDDLAAFGRRLRQLRAELGLSQGELAEKTGGGGINTVSNLERGIMVSIPLEMLSGLVRLAQTEGISNNWLFLGEGELHGATSTDQMGPIVADKIVRSLADMMVLRVRELEMLEGKAYAAAAFPKTVKPAPPVEIVAAEPPVETESAPPEEPPPAEPVFVVKELIDPGFRLLAAEEIAEDEDPRGRYVPLLGRISAGEGADTVEAEQFAPGRADAYLIYNDAPPGAFAVRVVGDSMTPDYTDGDLVVVDGNRPATNGVCCVLLDAGGEKIARIKRLKIRGKIAIIDSLNPAYPARRVPAAGLAAYEILVHLPRIVHGPRRKPKR